MRWQRAFSINVKMAHGKSDKRWADTEWGLFEQRTLSWISKQPAPSGVTSLSQIINNQPLPIQRLNRCLCTLDDLSVPTHLSAPAQMGHTAHTHLYRSTLAETNPPSHFSPAVSVQPQCRVSPLTGSAVVTAQCRTYCWRLKGIRAQPNQISITNTPPNHSSTARAQSSHISMLFLISICQPLSSTCFHLLRSELKCNKKWMSQA